MAQRAAHLVGPVLPFVPVRQWIVSLPFALRFRVADDHRLLSDVLGVCPRALLGLQRARARRILGVSGRCGAVTVGQRFGGALNVNVHFHVLVLDGVHGVHGETAPGRVAFRALARPTVAGLQALTEAIARRVRPLLRCLGLLEEDEELLSGDAGGDEDAALASCRAASARGLAVLPGRPGCGVRRVRLPEPDDAAKPAAPRGPVTGVAASASGFDVHAGAPPAPPAASGNGAIRHPGRGCWYPRAEGERSFILPARSESECTVTSASGGNSLKASTSAVSSMRSFVVCDPVPEASARMAPFSTPTRPHRR
jgi:hypothetical protein